MKRKFKIVATVLTLGIIGCLLWIYRPYAQPELSRVHPRVRVLKEPLKSVQAGYLLDGGSITLQLIDANDVMVRLAVPVGEAWKAYGTIYLDTAYHSSSHSGVKVEGFDNTAIYIQQLLRKQPDMDISRDLVLARWSGRGRDIIRFLVRRLSGQYTNQISLRM